MSHKPYNVIAARTTLTIRNFISISKNFLFSLRIAYVRLFVFCQKNKYSINHNCLWIFNSYQTKTNFYSTMREADSSILETSWVLTLKKAFLVYKSYYCLSFFYSRNLRHILVIFLIRICWSYHSSLQGARFLASDSLDFRKNPLSRCILLFFEDPILRLEQLEDPNIRLDLKSFLKSIMKMDWLFLDFFSFRTFLYLSLIRTIVYKSVKRLQKDAKCKAKC